MSSNVLCFSTHSERRLRKWIQIWSKNCNLFIHCILKGIVRYLIKMSQPYSNLHRFVHQVDTKTFTKIIDLNDSMAKDINYLQHSIKITVKIAQYKLSAYYLIYTIFKVGALYKIQCCIIHIYYFIHIIKYYPRVYNFLA